MTLSPAEIALIQRNRAASQSERAEFMEMAQEVCAMLDVPFAKVCGITRGNAEVCEARAMICRIAYDRGIHPKNIARYIRRDRTSVIHAIATTRGGESAKAPK